MHLGDQRAKLAVARSSRRRRTLLRCVIGRRGDPDAVLGEHSADRLDPEPAPMGVDERHYSPHWRSSPLPEQSRRRLQNLVRAAQLTVLAFEHLAAVDLSAAHPLAHRLRRRTQLAGDRADRLPLRPLQALAVEHHPHRPLTQLGGISPISWHRSILSRNRASTKTGVIHIT